MKKVKKIKICIVVAAAVVVAILALLFTAGRKITASEKKEVPASVTPEDGGFAPVSGKEVKLENEQVSFVMDTSTTHFSVSDKKSGVTYQSTVNVDPEKEGAKEYLSEVVLDYYDSDSMIHTLYSQNNSVAFEAYEINASEDAVRVYYNIRSRQDSFFVPSVFPKEVFEEQILGRLESGPARRMKLYYRLYNSENKEMLAQYPDLADQELYIIVEGLTDQDYAEITDYFKELDYTAEDYKKDTETMEISDEGVGERTSFLIPVEYKLTENGFTATVLSDQIESGSSSDYLAKVRLLPSFGGVTEQKEGYLLVPDGSGGIITFAEKAGTAYSQQLYGIDYAVDDQLSLQIAQNAVMPVFGMNRGDSGFLAIIEGAAECATVRGQVLGGTNLGTGIYAGFQLLTHDVTDIAAANSGTPFFNLYASEMNYGSPCVRYALLSADHCDYSAMAECYRNYLVEQGILNERVQEGGTVMYLDYTGYTTEEASFLGIPYEKKMLLSSVEKMTEDVEELYSQGIDSFSVRLKSYSGGGMKNGLVEKFDLTSEVGSAEELGQLAGVLNRQDKTLYLDDPIGRVYQDTAFDRFNRLDHGSRRVNKMVVIRGDSDIVLDSLDKKHNDYYLLSPKYYKSLVESFTDSVKKELGKTEEYGYSWSLFGSTLSGDYNMAETITRGQAREMAQEAAGSAEGFRSIMTDGGNIYVLPYADTILNLPLSDSGLGSVTEAVPFYQMVVHGYVNYAGAAQNTVADPETEWLKTIESGASLYYSCMTEDYTKIKDLSYRQKLYPVSMELCHDTIVEQYQEYESLFSKLASKLIVKHEIPEAGVHLTTYEDGTVVAVNYNSEAVTVNGTTVAAKNYAVNP